MLWILSFLLLLEFSNSQTLRTVVLGSKASLPCDIELPTPGDEVSLVLWYKDGIEMPIYSMNATEGPLSQSSDQLIRKPFFNKTARPAVLEITPVGPSDAGVYRCRVDFKKAQTRNYQIYVQVISESSVVPPEKPIIKDKLGRRVEGVIRSYAEGDYLVCESQGGKPLPSLTWWKGPILLDDTYQTFSNVVRNKLYYLTRDDRKGELTCQAYNNISAPAKTSVTLDLKFVPQLDLRLGRYLDGSDIREGSDVYFDCHIRASPAVHEKHWKFEGEELVTNTSAGVIVTNHSLVLQKLQRRNRGLYSCTAANSEGLGESNPVYLRVQFAPVCKAGQRTVYGATLHFPVEIACEVEADPEDRVDFRWEFNSPSGSAKPWPAITSGRKSVVHYILRSEQHYGKFSCLASNSVGKQQKPCIFKVIPAEPPSALHNCSIGQETEHFFRVSCYEGRDGGLDQFFQMEVYGANSSSLLFNLSSPSADFSVRGLSPGTAYALTIYAVNAKGRSAPLTIEASTLSGREDEHSVNPFLFNIFAIIGGIL